MPGLSGRTRRDRGPGLIRRRVPPHCFHNATSIRTAQGGVSLRAETGAGADCRFGLNAGATPITPALTRSSSERNPGRHTCTGTTPRISGTSLPAQATRPASFQRGALVRGAGGFCHVAIEQYAVEGQQRVGSAVDASTPVAEGLSDTAACEGRLLATMPETVEGSADELAPALQAVRPAIPVPVDGAAGHRKVVADTLARDGRGTRSCCGGSRG